MHESAAGRFHQYCLTVIPASQLLNAKPENVERESEIVAQVRLG